MLKPRKHTIYLTDVDIIDFEITKDRNTVREFSVNYRTKIEIVSKPKEVYRVDNFHGFLHEHKFWISPEPIPINFPKTNDDKYLVVEYVKDIKLNYEKYRKYYIDSLKKRA